MLLIALQIVTVVKCDLLADANIPPGHDPDVAINQFSLAVRRATVVNEFGRIPSHVAVEVMLRHPT